MKRCFSQSLLLFLSIVLLSAIIVVNKPLPSAVAATHPAIAGDLAAHDPSMIKQGNTYYVFSTGGGIQIRTSTDLANWKFSGTVFKTIPSWVTKIEGSITDLWAHDISYSSCVSHLYYAV